MKLFETFMESCVMMDKRTVADELGGFDYQWVEGATFSAAIVKDSTMAARVAEKQGVTEVYTVTVRKGATLQFHDVFKRLSDSAVFRVTSNETDSESPDVATFEIGQVTAERWELT